MIFDSKKSFAICVKYDEGLLRLKEFFADRRNIHDSDEFKKSLDFLSEKNNRHDYIVLEVGELIDFEEFGSSDASNLKELLSYEVELETLHNKINNLYEAKSNYPLLFENDEEKYFLTKIIDSIGITNWSNTLCFEPFPVKKITVDPDYLNASKIEFEYSGLGSFVWIQRITIDLTQREVTLVQDERRSYVMPLVDAFIANTLTQFQFNLPSVEDVEYTNMFLLFNSGLNQDVWILERSAIEPKNKEFALRGVRSREEYKCSHLK